MEIYHDCTKQEVLQEIDIPSYLSAPFILFRVLHLCSPNTRVQFGSTRQSTQGYPKGPSDVPLQRHKPGD